MKKSGVILSVLVISIIILAIVQVIVSNMFSTSGVSLSEVQEQTSLYKKENSIIAEKLLTVAAFTAISSRAAELGFVETKSRIYLSSPLPLAHR